jgi:F-type H+-transporting ATPase subunit delta
VRESIRGYTDALLEEASPDAEARLADEMAAVRALIEGSEDLRRVLGDPGVATHVRRTILLELLGNQVGANTLRLLAYAIDMDRATDVLGDVEWLAERTAAARDGRAAMWEGALGRSAAAERIDGYATAVLEEVSSEGRLGDVEDDLFRFMRVVDGSKQLRDAMASRELPAERRRALVVELLSGKANPASTRLAAYATRVGRPRDYIDHLGGLVERVAEEANRRVAEVRAAIDLDDEQRRRLGDALGRITGRPVAVRVSVDRDVLGGFVATIGDTVVDGSARHRLDILKERLVLPEATATTTGEPS